MKRFLTKLSFAPLLFLIGFLFAALVAQLDYRIEYILFSKSPRGNTYFNLLEYSELHIAPELIFLGSSTCNRGVVTQNFKEVEINAYNLCTSSQSFFNSKHLFRWALSAHAKPRYAVVDIYPLNWGSTGIESARDLATNHDYAHQPPFQEMAWATLDIATILKASYSALKKSISPFNAHHGSGDPFRKGGWTYSQRPPYEGDDCPAISVTLSRKQKTSFRWIRRTCEEEGIQLLLVNPPQLCEEVFEKPEVMEGLPWIEGNEWPLAKVDTLYYDDHHLRGVGAELYSQWLAEQVAALID